MDKRFERIIFICFFFSGMNALIYESAWLNRIQLVTGHTVYSLATTLASYMSGLALGSLYAPKLRRTGISPLLLYLVAELLIGLYGIAFYPLLKWIQIPYQFILMRGAYGLPTLSLLQFLFCGAIILIPTFLMGTTLPLLAPHLYSKKDEVSQRLPTLYAINTLGAFVGCLVASFFFLPNLGYYGTIQLAAIMSIGLYLIVRSIAAPQLQPFQTQFRWSQIRHALLVRVPRSDEKVFHSTEIGLLLVLFVSGYVSMTTQVLWNRLANLNFGSHVHIFSLVTSVVLGGIALGSLLWGKLKARYRNPHQVLSILPFLTALAMVIGNFGFSRSSIWVLKWNQTVAPQFFLRSLFEWLTCMTYLIIPATLLGMLFPVALSQLTTEHSADESTRALGIGYALNISGLVAGALLGSFFLLPSLGVEAISLINALLLIALSVFLTIQLRMSLLIPCLSLVIGAICVHMTPAFDWHLLTAGFFYNREHTLSVESLSELGWIDRTEFFLSRKSPLVEKRDEPHATLSIHRGVLDSYYRNFKVNGKVDGTNGSDLRTTRLLSAFPALINPNASSALIVGLGTGSTAAVALRYPRMKKVTVVELSAAMVEFSKKYFSNIDGMIWDDPRFEIRQRDGRNELETSAEQYDLIISEPSNPWMDGVASLFTEEYYQTLLRRLSPNGIASLWFHTYGLDCTSVFSVLNAVARVFPAALVFRHRSDLFIMATRNEEAIALKRLPNSHMILRGILFNELNDLFPVEGASEEVLYKVMLEKILLYDRQDILKVGSHVPMNQDDNQFLQFQSAKTFPSKIECQDFQGSSSYDTRKRHPID